MKSLHKGWWVLTLILFISLSAAGCGGDINTNEPNKDFVPVVEQSSDTDSDEPSKNQNLSTIREMHHHLKNKKMMIPACLMQKHQLKIKKLTNQLLQHQ